MVVVLLSWMFDDTSHTRLTTTEGVFSQIVDISGLAKDDLFGRDNHVAYHEQFLDNELNVSSALTMPHAYIVEPVFSDVGNPSALVVGYMQGLVPFDRLLQNVLPEGVRGVYVVLENNCAEQFTYVLNGNEVSFVAASLDMDLAGNEANTLSFSLPRQRLLVLEIYTILISMTQPSSFRCTTTSIPMLHPRFRVTANTHSRHIPRQNTRTASSRASRRQCWYRLLSFLLPWP